jgi:hypothetical protein
VSYLAFGIMCRSLNVIIVVLALIALPSMSSRRVVSGVELSELARSSTRIVLGRVERIEHLERPPRELRSDSPLLERWKDLPSIDLAELKIERTFKGRSTAKSMWVHARLRSSASARDAVIGERFLLFLDEPIYYFPFGQEFRERVIALTGEMRVEQVAIDGAVSIDRATDPVARIASAIELPLSLAKLVRREDKTAALLWSTFEAELSQTLSRQLPIIHAFDTWMDHWELFVYGDRRCVLSTRFGGHAYRRDFELNAKAFETLWKMFETEHFRELPATVGGGGSPDDSDFQLIDATTNERVWSVRIWDAHDPKHPIKDSAMGRAVRVMNALKRLPQDPSAQESR